jgi:hypothetical protein
VASFCFLESLEPLEAGEVLESPEALENIALRWKNKKSRKKCILYLFSSEKNAITRTYT